MYHQSTMEATSTQPAHYRLTEENLELHTSRLQNNARSYSIGTDQTWESYHQIIDEDDCAESEDGDFDTRMNNIALRRAASLEALKIYGGCFASGFLAMQDPWRQTPIVPQHQQYYLDVETLELRELALEMASIESGNIETGSANMASSVGKPRPDSVVLSPAGAQREKSQRKWSWKNIAKRRHSKSNKPHM